MLLEISINLLMEERLTRSKLVQNQKLSQEKFMKNLILSIFSPFNEEENAAGHRRRA